MVVGMWTSKVSTRPHAHNHYDDRDQQGVARLPTLDRLLHNLTHATPPRDLGEAAAALAVLGDAVLQRRQ